MGCFAHYRLLICVWRENFRSRYELARIYPQRKIGDNRKRENGMKLELINEKDGMSLIEKE